LRRSTVPSWGKSNSTSIDDDSACQVLSDYLKSLQYSNSRFFRANVYTYVGDDPLDKTDPTGETCTSNNGTYSCQVDSIRDAKNNVTQRADFSKDQVKQVAAFEKSYTTAVNDLASHPDRTATVSVSGGGKDQTVTAGSIAQSLADRTVIASPSEKPGAYTSGYSTIVGERGLSGVGSFKGVQPSSADQARQIAITHEGIHDTKGDRTRGTLNVTEFGAAHQAPFNQAAKQLLGEPDE